MIRTSYPIGDVFFPGLETNDRESSGNLGRIAIGGDRGDVGAVSAFSSQLDGEEGVVLEDVTFLTTLEELADDEVENEVRTVVEACYDSIQEETFAQRRSG